jgi:hypothetical protein
MAPKLSVVSELADGLTIVSFNYLDVKIPRLLATDGGDGVQSTVSPLAAQHRDALDVVGHRVQVQRAQGGEGVAVVGEVRHVARQGREVAGDVDHHPGTPDGDTRHHGAAGAGPRRVEDDGVHLVGGHP